MTQPIYQSYGDIQANVLTSFGTVAAGYFFLGITDLGAFRTALRDILLARVTTEQAVRNSRDVDQAVQIGFTYAGLQRLGVDNAQLAQLPEAFVKGMAQRAAVLGDLNMSSPLNWEGSFGRGSIHLVVSVLSRSANPDDVDTAWEKLKAAGALEGAVPLHVCRGQSVFAHNGEVRYRVEPFGFRDGISQPDVDLPDTSAADGEFGRIAPGEFILGYDDETDRALKRTHPETMALLQNGTYMVFRKIQQFKSELDKFAAAQAHGSADEARLKAELFGRWPDGAILTDAPQPPAQPDAEANKFLFKPLDNRCPVWSHIRRANPRDDLGPELVRRHRIIRRGIRYQSNGDGEGVLFVCFNARIDDQFEFVQGNWLNNGNFAGLLSNSVDPIAGSSGNSTATYERPGGGCIKNLPELTRVRGGEYFLVPSRTALAQLADAGREPPVHPVLPGPSDDLFDFVAMGVESLKQEAPSKPIARPTGTERMYYVGQHDLVTKALQNDQGFEVTPYDERIKSLTGGQRLLVGMSPVRDKDLRDRRKKLLDAAMSSDTDQAPVTAIIHAVLNRIDPKSGPIDLIESIARAVPLALVVDYLGVREPDPPLSETFIALTFGRMPGEVPPEWQKKFVAEQKGREGMVNLAFWTRMLFVETFLNIEEMPEVRFFALIAIGELFAHLDKVIASPVDGTVLERALAKGSKEDARLLILELMVGGTDTTTSAIANVVDVLLTCDDAMTAARDVVRRGGSDAELDAIIQECLRLQPAAGMLQRLSTGQSSSVGGTSIEANSRVCILTAAASQDPRVFRNGQAFDPTRDPNLYRNFGVGAHECPGQWLALLQLRTVLRWLLAFPRFRRAAGPQGQKIEDYYLPTSFYVWLE
jgi:Dyp-type peroxidase family